MEEVTASTTADGAIVDMLSMVRACGKVKIVDPEGRANHNDHMIQEGPKSNEYFSNNLMAALDQVLLPWATVYVFLMDLLYPRHSFPSNRRTRKCMLA